MRMKALSRSLSLCLIAALATISFAEEALGFVVTGKLQYADGDALGQSGSPPWAPPPLDTKLTKPSRLVEVSAIYRTVGGDGDETVWVLARTLTDSRGEFVLEIPAVDDRVMIVAEIKNAFVRVYRDTDFVNEPFVVPLTSYVTPVNRALGIRTMSNTYITYRPYEGWYSIGGREENQISPAAAHNINETILVAAEEVRANRDPREVDSLSRVDVEYCDRTSKGNHYFSDLVFECFAERAGGDDGGWSDRLIGHEYTHHLQYAIGDWDLHWGFHNRCIEDPNPGTSASQVADGAEFAWSEGFADYFGMRLVLTHPGMSQTSLTGRGHPDKTCFENFATPITFHGGVADAIQARIAVEQNIVNVLWDLTDGLGLQDRNPATDGIGTDSWDLVDGAGETFDGFRTILQIFDRELDSIATPIVNAPDFSDFYRAWVGRHGTTDLAVGAPALDAILNGLEIRPRMSEFPTPGDDEPPAPTFDARARGFVEPAPVLGPGMFDSEYDSATNSLGLRAAWSYLDSLNPGATQVAIFATGIGDTTVFLEHRHTAVTGASTGASFDANAVRYTRGEPGWLESSPTHLGAGPLVPSEKHILLVEPNATAVEGLPIGVHEAEVDVRFDFDGPRSETRTISYSLSVRDTASSDSDVDGLNNGIEVASVCLDPRNRDTDGDTLGDGEEVNEHGTNPCVVDTDGDGADDGFEVRAGACFDPNVSNALDQPLSDRDGDGLNNLAEVSARTDACDDDTDDDGVVDGSDNCPRDHNPGQGDLDGDGAGDVCDRDEDGDGVPDLIDSNPRDASAGPVITLDEVLVRFVRLGRFNAAPDLGRGFCDPAICSPRGGVSLRERVPPNASCFAGECEGPSIEALDPRLRRAAVTQGALLGVTAEDGWGTTMIGLPDLDSDGTPDFAVGAPGADSLEGVVDAGAVVLISGASLVPILRLDGPEEGSHLGVSLLYLGREGLLVGAPGSATVPGRIQRIDLGTGATTETFSAGEGGDRFGESLAPLGSALSGDGTQEFLAGAPGASAGSGAIYRTRLGGSPLVAISGVESGAELGAVVEVVGDLNGDDAPEFLASSPSANAGAGRVALFSLDGSTVWDVLGLQAGDRLGTAVLIDPAPGASPRGWSPVALAGNGLSQNGTSDQPQALWVGAPGASTGAGADAGQVFAVSLAGQMIPVFEGDQAGAGLGVFLASGPDLDGDGEPSLILGDRDPAVNEWRASFVERRNPTVQCQDDVDNDVDGDVDWDGGSGSAAADAACIAEPWSDREDRSSLQIVGEAAGGRIDLTVEGNLLSVTTQAGASSATIAAATAAAINSDAALTAARLWAVTDGSTVTLDGRLDAVRFLDPGLDESAAPGVPALGRIGLLALGGLLLGVYRLRSRR
jgi:hypothetical protein